MRFINYGDVSPEHGQEWIAYGGDDYAEIVTIRSGSDLQLADNQYMIERGTIYFSPNNWDSALSIYGFNEQVGPPEYWQVAVAFNAYQGFDRDCWRGFEIVQVGKHPDDWTASGTTCENPDVTLHGNASIEIYLKREYLA